jgi:hypothetical protein
MKEYKSEVTVYEASDGTKFIGLEKNTYFCTKDVKRKAQEYEEELNNVENKTTPHKIIKGELVYISHRDRVRTCRVTKIYETITEDYWSKEKQDYIKARISKIDLLDLTEENRELADYTFTSDQIGGIKKNIEDLILPVVYYDN